MLLITSFHRKDLLNVPVGDDDFISECLHLMCECVSISERQKNACPETSFNAFILGRGSSSTAQNVASFFSCSWSMSSRMYMYFISCKLGLGHEIYRTRGWCNTILGLQIFHITQTPSQNKPITTIPKKGRRRVRRICYREIKCEHFWSGPTVWCFGAPGPG